MANDSRSENRSSSRMRSGPLRGLAIYAALALLGVSLSGCATLVRGRYNQDAFFPTKTGVNIVSDSTDKDAKVMINGKEADGTLIYAGSENGSPFYVRRFLLKKASDPIKVDITTANGTQSVSVERESEYGWWLVGGLWTIVDSFTGALHTYGDIVVDPGPVAASPAPLPSAAPQAPTQ
ncbi:MAG: hypothetical protein JF616_10260 [Fibrobacteres bacterium]|nr:hypothetical protein [Fibrobacterota bacterium]